MAFVWLLAALGLLMLGMIIGPGLILAVIHGKKTDGGFDIPIGKETMHPSHPDFNPDILHYN